MLDESSRDITTFSDGVSLYRFKRLPCGLSCSPAIFSRQMAQLLFPLIRQGWIKNYRDDGIVFAPDFGTVLSRLDTLFKYLSQGGVKLSFNKCVIGKREVKFLGHVVSEAGCRPDPENVKAVQNMKPPTNAKGVRSFLGMCGFYRKHSRVCKDRSPSNKFNPQEHRVQVDWRLSGGVWRIKIPPLPPLVTTERVHAIHAGKHIVNWSGAGRDSNPGPTEREPSVIPVRPKGSSMPKCLGASTAHAGCYKCAKNCYT